MRPWYAHNARDLLETRRQGLKPDAPVNVSLMGPVSDALTLFVRDDMPADRLDWRMLANVEVVVWADSTVPFDRVSAVLLGIARAQPTELLLGLLHADAWHLIDCGSGAHLPALGDVPATHAFLWHPVNLDSTVLSRKLKTALHKTHRPGAPL